MANTTPNEKVYSITGLIWIICYKKNKSFWTVWTFWWEYESWIRSIYLSNKVTKGDLTGAARVDRLKRAAKNIFS